MESGGEQRSVTRLGLWLTGSWPVDPVDLGVPDYGLPVDLGVPDSGLPSVLDHVAALAQCAEEVGFDSVWVTDRVPTKAPDGSGHPDPEAYSLLGALATRTRTVRLGAVPLGEDRRPPSLVAKIVTGIDVISHGRGVLTYGLGPSDAVRGARTTEAVRVGRALLEDEAPSFEGAFYTVAEAMNRPRPVQPGGVPVVVCFEHAGDRATVAVTEFAGLADAVIVEGTAGDLRRVVEGVRSIPDPGAPVLGGSGGPLQVIGIGLLPGMAGPRPDGTQPGQGITDARASSLVSELFDAGADGCLVPLDLSTPVASLRAMAAGSRAT